MKTQKSSLKEIAQNIVPLLHDFIQAKFGNAVLNSFEVENGGFKFSIRKKNFKIDIGNMKCYSYGLGMNALGTVTKGLIEDGASEMITENVRNHLEEIYGRKITWGV